MIPCCVKNCNEPSFVTFHDEEKDVAACGCMDHYHNAAYKFEDELRGHPHFRYVAYCDYCGTIISKEDATIATTSDQPRCVRHPTNRLKLFQLSANHMFKECVWEDK